MRKEVIGNATLYLGDCVDLVKDLPTESINLLWSDPPYGNENHSGDFNARLNEIRNIESQPILNDDLINTKRVVDAVLNEATRFLAKTSAVALCVGGGGGPKPTFAWLADRMDNKGLTFFHSIIWDKKNPGIGWCYRRQHEMVMVAFRADGKLGWPDKNMQVPNIIALYPPRERAHPNQKPHQLMEGFITWHTALGELVLDTFMGSGSTGVAAVQLGRKFIGMELDPKHFDVACKRLEEAQKQESIF